jgi:hypothetical protein
VDVWILLLISCGWVLIVGAIVFYCERGHPLDEVDVREKGERELTRPESDRLAGIQGEKAHIDASRGGCSFGPTAVDDGGSGPVDVATIDQEYQQLQQESGELTQAIQDFATKLQTAGNAGDEQAKEWVLDLKGVALQIQQEQLQMQALLVALHDFVGNALQAPAAAPGPAVAPTAPAPAAAAPLQAPAEQPAQQQGGGMLSRFRGGGFGQAMTQGVGLGVGFGLADSVINSIFN